MTTKTKNKVQKLAGVSFEQVTQSVSEALREAYPTPPNECSVWPTEVYDDRVVYSKDGSYWQESFTYADGKVTLGGNPVAVVRAYVPVTGTGGGNAPAQKTEKSMKAKVSKAGGSDIVALAAERLGVLGKELGKGDGAITAEVSAEIDAVIALLQTARDLYSGGGAGGGEGDGGEEGEGGEEEALEMAMAELAESAKRAGIVKMTGPQFLVYAVDQMKRCKAETDPIAKAVRMTALEKALTYASYWTGAAFEGGTDEAFPVAVMAESGPKEESVSTEPANPAGVGPAAAGGATAIGGSTSQNTTLQGSSTFTQKLADVQKMVDSLKSGKPIAKSEGAGSQPVAKGTPGNTEPGLWPASYVDTLPDSAFLYVEQGANKSETGTTMPAFRHFPIRDIDGKLSKAQLAHAIKMIPTFGATPEFKADLLAKANGLFGLEQSVEKSAAGASARGDDGWPDDMADPDFLSGRKPVKAAALFGFDGIVEKAEAIAKAEQEG